MIEKISETENWLFEKKINGIKIPLAILTKMKSENINTNIRNELEDFTTDSTAIEKLTRDCFEHLCS